MIHILYVLCFEIVYSVKQHITSGGPTCRLDDHCKTVYLPLRKVTQCSFQITGPYLYYLQYLRSMNM